MIAECERRIHQDVTMSQMCKLNNKIIGVDDESSSGLPYLKHFPMSVIEDNQPC